MSKNSTRSDALKSDKPSSQERFLTVCLYPETNPHVPWIRLRGLWLRQAGFTPKSRVRVRVMPGCLVITKE
jgi:hypothetical protein